MIQGSFPGVEPRYYRLELELVEGEGWQVRTVASDSRRYISSADSNVYDGLALAEALDVAQADLASRYGY